MCYERQVSYQSPDCHMLHTAKWGKESRRKRKPLSREDIEVPGVTYLSQSSQITRTDRIWTPDSGGQTLHAIQSCNVQQSNRLAF